MLSYADHTLTQYLEHLSAREPVPGGGSAAAVSAALGAALLAMSARYSVGKGKPRSIENRLEKVIAAAEQGRSLFTLLAGLDAQAYLDVVSARKSGNAAALKKANCAAARVPKDLIKACRDLLKNVAFLKQHANPYLLSDVRAAEVFLAAAVDAAQFMIEANQ
jgi:formiminotetrahydrofolate cyclodeaminase